MKPDFWIFYLCIVERQTFDEANNWIGDVRKERGDEVVMVLVGNKIDLESER